MTRMKIVTEYPVARDSIEYNIRPESRRDNSRNLKFNKKLEIFCGSVLDLGCAGGAFVKDCLDEGRVAIGIEGNDYNIRKKRHEWPNIPESLFTCDITKPFIVCPLEADTNDSCTYDPYLFDIITAWEVLEHIPESRIHQFFSNVYDHMGREGLFIVSISNKPSFNKAGIDVHVTQKMPEWWEAELSEHGLIRVPAIEKYFDPDWIRNEKGSFHFVLQRLW